MGLNSTPELESERFLKKKKKKKKELESEWEGLNTKSYTLSTAISSVSFFFYKKHPPLLHIKSVSHPHCA